MTEEQKEILIAKMLDAPSSLSDEELDLILHDAELRDIYDASAALCSACMRQPVLDMEAEWTAFRPRIRRKPSPERWIMRVAAIFLGVLLLSGIVTKIVDKVFAPDERPIAKAEPATDSVAPLLELPAQLITESVPGAEPVVKKSKPAVSKGHIATAEIARPSRNDAPAEPDIDIDEYLRAQQARIDNDLAMQAAEAYMEEYRQLIPLLDAAGVYSSELDNAIQKVTME